MKFNKYLLAVSVCIATPAMAQSSMETIESNCLTGDAKSCLVAGYANLNGVKAEKNVTKSETLFERGCTLGELEACHVIATRFNKSDSYKRLSELCSKGHDASCASKAYSELEGLSTKKNVKKGIQTAQASCGKSGSQSCTILASIYFLGLYNQKIDNDKGVSYLEKSCKLKMYSSCKQVAKIYSEGRLIKPNAEKVLESLSTMCSLGDKKSCSTIETYRGKTQ